MTSAVADQPIAQAPDAVALEMFTDEELAVLGGPDSIVVSPFLDQVPDTDRAAALRTAYRGLLARGILDPPTTAPPAPEPGADTVDVELTVRQDVHAMMTLRRAAQCVVAIARTTAGSQDYWYAHVVDDVCLLEQVGSDGLHRFALSDATDLPDRVTEAALHPEATGGTGAPIEVPATDGATLPRPVLERVGTAAIRADLVVRSVGDDAPTLFGLFSGPAGTWRFRSDYGSGRPVQLEAVAADSLRREVRDHINGVLAGLARGREAHDE